MAADDATLWAQWNEEQDPDAFAELLNRYSGMVYATCRRIASNSADAEDATQECFVRMMNTNVRVESSLGPWLHAVATRCSLDLVKSRKRRTVREEIYGEGSSAQTSAEVDDIVEHVDAALSELPEDARAVLIERFFLGETFEQVGARYGVTESTARHRVEKAVGLLREGLKRKGIATSAGSVSVALGTHASASIPTAVMTRLSKLALAGTRTAATSPGHGEGLTLGLKWAAACVLGVVIASVAMFGTSSPGTPEPVVVPLASDEVADGLAVSADETSSTDAMITTTTDDSPTPDSEIVVAQASGESAVLPDDDEAEDESTTISGRVYDDRGYPIEGAKVTCVGWWGLQGPRVSGTTTYSSKGKTSTQRNSNSPAMAYSAFTDVDGNFTIEDVYFEASGGIQSGDSMLTVTAPGFQSHGQRLIFHDKRVVEGLEAVLEPGIMFHGMVVDENGSPVPDAIVECVSLTPRGDARNINETTDELGRFTFGFEDYAVTGKRVFMRNADGESVRTSEIPTYVCFRTHTRDGRQNVFPRVLTTSDEVATLRLQRSATLLGTVRYEDGSPAAERSVYVTGRFALTDNVPDFAAQAKSWSAFEIERAYSYGVLTDQNGQFELAGIPPIEDITVSVMGEPDRDGSSSALWTESLGPVLPGEKRVWERTITSKSDAMTLTGRIIGATTGEPQLLATIRARNNESGNEYSKSINVFYQTLPDDATNEYTLVLPERGDYTVWVGYHHMRWPELEATTERQIQWKSGTREGIDFKLPETFTLSWQVVDVEGEPIPDANLDLVNGGTIFRSGTTDEKGEFTFGGFIPDKYAQFAKVGKPDYVTVETVPTHGGPADVLPTQTVVLHEGGGVEGIVVDANGAILANATLHFAYESPEFITHHREGGLPGIRERIKTDSDGRFTILESLPALPGTLTISTDTIENSQTSGPIELTILPRQVLELGSIQLQAVTVE